MTQNGRYHIKLIGNFQLFDPSGREIVLTNKRGKALIAFLALTDGNMSDRPSIYNNLWDTERTLASDKKLQERLRSCLKDLMKSLDRACSIPLIQKERNNFLRLLTDNADIDLHTFRNRLDNWNITDNIDFLTLSNPCQILCQLDIVKDQALTDWLTQKREEWKEELSHKLRTILETIVQKRDHDLDPMPVATLLLRLDPADENTHYTLMYWHGQQEARAAAKQQYERCKKALREEADVTPSRKTRELMNEIANDTFVSDNPDTKTSSISITNTLGPTSIAVLPFQCMSSTDETERLRTGLCQEIIGALSRISEFAVTDQSSVFNLVETNQSLKTIGHSLGVEFLLTGMIRSTANQCRVSINLVRCADLKVIWNRNYTGNMDETFESEDRISQAVAGELEPELIQHIISRVIRGDNHLRTAYEWTLRAIPQIYNLDRRQFDEAKRYLEKALEIDPHSAPAHTWLAFWHAFNSGQDWNQSKKALKYAHHHARKAIQLDPDDARAYAIAGHVQAFLLGDLEAGEHLLDRSLSLNNNSGFAWAFSAVGQCYLGRPQEGLKRMEMYKKLCPLDTYSFFFETIYCIAYTLLQRYDLACEWGRRTVDQNPNFANGYKPFLASLGHSGRSEEADIYRQKLLTLEPDFTIQKFQNSYHLRNRSMMLTYCEGLHLAGIPKR